MKSHRTSLKSLKVFALCLATQLLPSFPVASAPDQYPLRVFLAGNSIIYTNNLPAVLTEIAISNGKRLTVDMFARGGAQISDLLASEQVAAAIRSGKYDAVIFHDRGGDALCATSRSIPLHAECNRMIENHRQLAELVREYGSTPFLLGTYQPPSASLRLVRGERHIADEINVSHIEISEKWNQAKVTVQDAPWLAEDGMHPGRALTTLMAMEIYHTLFGSYPQPDRISTTAPLYVPRNKLKQIVRLEELPREEVNEVLSAEQAEQILAVLRSRRSN